MLLLLRNLLFLPLDPAQLDPTFLLLLLLLCPQHLLLLPLLPLLLLPLVGNLHLLLRQPLLLQSQFLDPRRPELLLLQAHFPLLLLVLLLFKQLSLSIYFLRCAALRLGPDRRW